MSGVIPRRCERAAIHKCAVRVVCGRWFSVEPPKTEPVQTVQSEGKLYRIVASRMVHHTLAWSPFKIFVTVPRNDLSSGTEAWRVSIELVNPVPFRRMLNSISVVVSHKNPSSRGSAGDQPRRNMRPSQPPTTNGVRGRVVLFDRGGLRASGWAALCCTTRVSNDQSQHMLRVR